MEVCTCGCPKSSDPSNHAKHLKSAKHLRGGKVKYICKPCSLTFTNKGHYTEHCGCQIHKAKAWGNLPYNELGDVSGIVSRDQYKGFGLREMRNNFIFHYLDRNCAFMTSMQSEVVHVFKDTWREMPMSQFMYLLDSLVTGALESSGIRARDLKWILKLGHTENGGVTKPHAFWIKKQLLDCYRTQANDVAPPWVERIVSEEPVAQSVARAPPSSLASPDAQPVEEPDAQPVEEPVAQPVAQPVEQPVEQPVAQPVAQPEPEPVVEQAKPKKGKNQKVEQVLDITVINRLTRRKLALETQISEEISDAREYLERDLVEAIERTRAKYAGLDDYILQEIEEQTQKYAKMIENIEVDEGLTDILEEIVKDIKREEKKMNA